MDDECESHSLCGTQNSTALRHREERPVQQTYQSAPSHGSTALSASAHRLLEALESNDHVEQLAALRRFIAQVSNNIVADAAAGSDRGSGAFQRGPQSHREQELGEVLEAAYQCRAEFKGEETRQGVGATEGLKERLQKIAA